MPHLDFRDHTLTTTCFGDRVKINVPVGGRVVIETINGHSEVEIRESAGAVVRRFRLRKENV